MYAGPLADPLKAQEHLLRLAPERGADKVLKTDDSDLPESIEFGTIPNEIERAKLLREKRPPPINQSKPSGKTFTIVSGLPRSGTSLMMQMLQAGGMEPKTDGTRAADIDNPKGYYEWEAIKQVARKPQLLDEEGLSDKSIKVVTALLPSLPYRHHYKIVFMDRPIDEVIVSQEKMMARLGTSATDYSRGRMQQELLLHRQLTLAWLEQHPRAEYLIVSYGELLRNPESCIDRLFGFLGEARILHPERMLTVIDKSLYRNVLGASS